MQNIWFIWFPFHISILKVWWTQFLSHTLHFNVFSMIQDYFLQSLGISSNLRGVTQFLGEPILQEVWIIWLPFLYFNFKSSMDTISASFIRFQCILHDSGILFAESWSFYKLKRGDLISGGSQFCRKSELFGHRFSISISKVF